MSTWKAKNPMRRKKRRLFGRTYFRYVCGTCDDHSRWKRGGGDHHWPRLHLLNNTYCSEKS